MGGETILSGQLYMLVAEQEESVAEVRERVSSLEGGMAGIGGKLSEISVKLTEMNGSLSLLGEKVASLQPGGTADGTPMTTEDIESLFGES